MMNPVMRGLFLTLFLILLFPSGASAFKGMDTRDIVPSCVIRTVRDIYNIDSKWWLRTDREPVPILGVRLPDGSSRLGRRLMRYLKARYKGEAVKICRPAWAPMGKDVYGFIYSEPWPLSLQDELVEKGLAHPGKSRIP